MSKVIRLMSEARDKKSESAGWVYLTKWLNVLVVVLAIVTLASIVMM